jgi:hypothetical protein
MYQSKSIVLDFYFDRKFKDTCRNQLRTTRKQFIFKILLQYFNTSESKNKKNSKKKQLRLFAKLKRKFFNFDYLFNADLNERAFFSNEFDQVFIDNVFSFEKELNLNKVDGFFGQFWSILNFKTLTDTNKFEPNKGEILIFGKTLGSKLTRDETHDE